MQTSHDQIILALDAIRLDHEQTIQDYAKRLEETQEALEASKPVLVEAKQIIAAKNDKLDMVNQQGIEDQANMAGMSFLSQLNAYLRPEVLTQK